MKRAFITATGTGVGKTLVACALTWQLRQQGKHVHTLKPIISDFAEHNLEVTDTYEIIQALGQDVSTDWISGISPWRFVAPLSPDMAATRENREIDFHDLLAFCNRDLQADVKLIEGVGGVFVPINGKRLVADWIKALDIPAIIVAGSYLGTLSHTIATCEALDARGVAVSHVVISESEESPVPLEETRDTLARFLPDIRFTLLPRVPDWKSAPDLTHLVESG